ncbi:MAG: outer membrane protein transport protein [Pirellulales bacterium]
MRTSIVVSVLVLCAVALVGPRARADGLIRDGVGAISTGRGGTNIGHSDNAAVILDNPAGMVGIRGCGLFELGVDTLFTDLDYRDADPNDVDGKLKAFPAPELGYIRKSADGDFAVGLGLFIPAGFGAEYDMVNPIVGPSLYKSVGVLGKILPGVAYRLTDRLSVGGTFGVAISHAELEGPFFLQTGALAGVPTQFDLQATGAAPTGSLGFQYELTEATTLGLAYISESRFRMDGSLGVNVFGLAPFPVNSDFDAEVDLVWPRSLGVGFKHDLCRHRRISADVIWYDWSHAFDRLDLQLTNSSNPLFTGMLGPVIRDTFPLDWHDTVSLRLGYEWAPTLADVYRLGYVYHESPVPSTTLNPYVDGVLEHAFSVGWSRRRARGILNLAYQYSFGPERNVVDSAIVGGDFDNSTFEAQAHWFSVSWLVPL